MDRHLFGSLTVSEQLWEIYKILPKPTAPGESPLAGIFGPERVVHEREVWSPPEGPEGFKAIFGAFPADTVQGSPQRAQWKDRVERWGGTYNLEQFVDYNSKAKQAFDAGLGVPLAYVFDGDVFITFSKVAVNNRHWKRDLSFFLDDGKYSNMIASAGVLL